MVAQMPNVQVLSLSVNRISSLAPFASCPRLQELYLRKNEIADVDDIAAIAHLPDLRVLWLQVRDRTF